MNESEVHPWFASTTGVTLTSHNGATTSETRPGTLQAFLDARRQGYRWLQVDVIPIQGDLLSQHATFGRKLGFERQTIEQIRAKTPDAITLRELLAHPDLQDVHWNIELKSKRGLDHLCELLRGLEGTRDLRSILISSPMRPSVLQELHKAFPDVALAAPVIHGGVFGVRFLGRRRARIYDCQQCYHRFVRSPNPRRERPPSQAWTIRSRAQLHRLADKRAHLIVDSEPLDLPQRDNAAMTRPPRTLPDVAVLALGGGGWRSAFGGIGAVMYFAETNRWPRIREVVGISGGSFAVATLSERPADNDPGPAMVQLLGRLQYAGKRAAGIVWSGALVVVVMILLAALLGVVTWTQRSPWMAVLILPVLGLSSFLLRLVVSLRSRAIVRKIFGSARMDSSQAVLSRSDGTRRFRIGATGLNDGNLYAFTTHPEHDRRRRDDDPSLPAPLGGRLLSDAVVRATSLPGLGQMGPKRLYLCDHHQHVDECESRPDRLVDGGISGIFGRGLVEARPPAYCDGVPLMVVVDGGRSLVVDHGRRLIEHLRDLAQRLSALALLVRWLQVALEVAYRAELTRVKDDEMSDGYRTRLVRLAEEEAGRLDGSGSMRRRYNVERLLLLRDRVHSFSLVKASPAHVNRGIAVAIAACALEFQEDPDVAHILRRVGAKLGRGRELADLWQRIPLRGEPVGLVAEELELGPEEMVGA